MLIAQITDIHIGNDPTTRLNDARLSQVVERLNQVRPDVVVATGDLTENGGVDCYRRLRDLLAPLDAPVHFALGNHDVRADFLAVYPETPVMGGFVQYERDLGGMRLLVLDTLEEGRHGGAFCEVREGWLRDRLAEAPDTPTLIALHHPPVKSGIGWIDGAVDGPWSRRLAAALDGQDQIVGMIAGHIHRGMTAPFAGQVVTTASSCAPQLALDLSAMRPDRPDARPLIVEEPPAFSLHLWSGGALTTHFASAGAAPVLARYDASTRGMIADLATA